MKAIQQRATSLRGLRRGGGFALTELLLTIGIIALVLGAVAAIAISTSAGQTAQSEARIIDSAANKIRSVYSSRADFDGVSTTNSISMQAWPSNMVTGAANIYNAWGGAVNVEESTTSRSNQLAARLFEISTNNVSENACAELATAQTSALAVLVGTTLVYERGSSTLDPINAALVTSTCAEGAEVTFVFGKNG